MIGHGSGGKLSQDLIRRVFLTAFDNPILQRGDDAGLIELEQSLSGARLAISTDSHVVWPLFFPGGDIGKLAVCGTVNDIAMLGAQPLALAAGFILEEGLDVSILERIADSMRVAAQEAGVQIVTGDTKVVQKGKADGLYINTTGFGLVAAGIHIGGAQARPGDAILISGSLGNHGIAVLTARGDLGIESSVQSDVAPLNHLVAAMLGASKNIHVLRDPTRGGLAATLNEIAQQSRAGMLIQESLLQIDPAVSAACEMLGFDPLTIANEGKLLAIAAPEDVPALLSAMRRTRYGENAAVIGEVLTAPAGRVLMKTPLGSTRIVDMPSGELLPRIC